MPDSLRKGISGAAVVLWAGVVQPTEIMRIRCTGDVIQSRSASCVAGDIRDIAIPSFRKYLWIRVVPVGSGY